jgi:hypothetical protein
VESGIRFEDRGTHRLKGVPDGWRLYRVLEDYIVVVEDKTSVSIPNLRTAGRGEGRLEAVRRLFLGRYGSGLRQGLGSTLFFSSPWGVALVLMRGKHLLRQPIKSGDNRDSSCFGPRQHFAGCPTENPFLVAFGQVICAAYAEEGFRIGMVIGGNREITRPHQALDAEGVDNPS